MKKLVWIILLGLLTNPWANEVIVYNKDGVLVDIYTTIQARIDACLPGGTVTVSRGIYNEAIYINKNIALIGIGVPTITNNTILDNKLRGTYCDYSFTTMKFLDNFIDEFKENGYDVRVISPLRRHQHFKSRFNFYTQLSSLGHNFI